jgi:hypothetical protein
MENASNLTMADEPSRGARRLFEDETGRNFGKHAGETSLSFESFAERRRGERFLEPQQYPAGDVYAPVAPNVSARSPAADPRNAQKCENALIVQSAS